MSHQGCQHCQQQVPLPPGCLCASTPSRQQVGALQPGTASCQTGGSCSSGLAGAQPCVRVCSMASKVHSNNTQRVGAST